MWTLQSITEPLQQHLEDVFNIFEFLYGQLNVDMRRCLLYATLFPEGYEIYNDYLVEGWKVQGFIHDVQGGNEILDIRDTGIHSLPIEIGQLKNLKCFRVSFPYNNAIADSPKNNILHCWKHKKLSVMISPDLIKKLHQLKELTIIVDPRDQSWKGIKDNIAKEVASLKHLTTLCFNFPGEASPSVYRTPPEASPSVNGHGIIFSQPLDYEYDIPLANLNHNHNHNNGEIQETSSSNSMTATARPLPPSDPSPLTWFSTVTHHSRLSVKKSQPTNPSALSPSTITNNGTNS
ncbi:putative disease resistance protein [Camellia lanceoleosa]|uniref:Disease resistance protein n=1 Tax=Camellia lanceoleosa TaxID=1840588 RepID=A0ACC0GNZ1_9ERIC|nr:putative disease resistance protein [Camellia lanceoleosa]